MGFFSKLFGGKSEDEIDFNIYLEFAKLISLDDKKVLFQKIKNFMKIEE